MKLNVLTHPNKTLNTPSAPVPDADIQSEKIQTLIDNMIETMAAENGIGIAAPQIGENVRIIIAETKKGPQAFINPKIISTSNTKIDFQEGCLSIPGVWGIVERHKSCKIKAKDRNGDPVRIKADKLLSIVFQHEIDHLDGILFIEKAKKITKGDIPEEAYL